MYLSFKIAAGPPQRSHSQIRVRRDSRPHFTVSDSRFPQPGGPGPLMYIPQDRGDPVIPPGTGFPYVACYDSQGYGGGIPTGLHTGGTVELSTPVRAPSPLITARRAEEILPLLRVHLSFCAYLLLWKHMLIS
jgi:hypothetical protein